MLNLDDPFVRRTAQVVVLVLAIFLAIPAVLASLISIDYLSWPEKTGDRTLAAIFLRFPNPEAAQVKELLSLLQVFIAAIPAVLIGVTVEKKGNNGAQELNRFGRSLVLVFGISLLFAIFAYLTIVPAQWGSDHRLELEGLQRLVSLVRGSLQTSVFYLALLFGLRAIK